MSCRFSYDGRTIIVHVGKSSRSSTAQSDSNDEHVSVRRSTRASSKPVRPIKITLPETYANRCVSDTYIYQQICACYITRLWNTLVPDRKHTNVIVALSSANIWHRLKISYAPKFFYLIGKSTMFIWISEVSYYSDKIQLCLDSQVFDDIVAIAICLTVVKTVSAICRGTSEAEQVESVPQASTVVQSIQPMDVTEWVQLTQVLPIFPCKHFTQLHLYIIQKYNITGG